MAATVRAGRGRSRLLCVAVGGLVLLALTMLGVVLHALWVAELPHRLHPAGVIVVLGGNLGPDGSIGRDTEERTRAGVALYKQGLAPHIHFTGGALPPGQVGPGEQMRRLAVSLGVPEAATSAESDSRSTLQNALFSQPILGPLAREPIILVSDGYHLGRSWATFRWAGYGPIQLYAESTFGPMPRRSQAWRILREGLAWYFNPVRVVLWYAGGLVGLPEPQRTMLLD